MKADTSCRATFCPTSRRTWRNSTKLVDARADYFRDVSLHRLLTVEVNAELKNGFYWLDDAWYQQCPGSGQSPLVFPAFGVNRTRLIQCLQR